MSKFKLSKLDLFEVKIPMRFTFSHNLATRKVAHNLIVKITTDKGNIGYAEVLPRSYLTGESIESSIKNITNNWWEMAKKISLESTSINKLFDSLYEIYRHADKEKLNASYTGIDIATIDAFAKENKISNYNMFKKFSPIHNVAVISAGSKKEVYLQTLALYLLGYKKFKVKVTKDEQADLARLSIVKSITKNNADIIIDANAAWTVEEAIKRINNISKNFNLIIVEQPIAAGNIAGLMTIKNSCNVAIMADEDICTLSDAYKLIASKAVDYWNLRLAKNGGFSGVKSLLDIAKCYNIQCYSGILVGESSVMSAASRYALGLGNFCMQEYGFPRILLKGDPFRGGPGGWSGYTEPLYKKIGLGVVLKENKLKKYLIKHLHIT